MRSWSHRGRYPPEGRRATAVRVAGKQELIICRDTGRPHPSLGRWVGDSSPQPRSRKFPATVTLGPACFSKGVAGYASSGPEVDITVSLLTPAKTQAIICMAWPM